MSIRETKVICMTMPNANGRDMVTAPNVLADQVNVALREGWELHGTMTIAGGIIYQQVKRIVQ